MSDLDKAREEYAALRAALAPRNHVTHHTDCGCFTIAADCPTARRTAMTGEERPGLCKECGHYLSSFRTCSVAPVDRCNRNWPNARCGFKRPNGAWEWMPGRPDRKEES